MNVAVMVRDRYFVVFMLCTSDTYLQQDILHLVTRPGRALIQE